MQTLITYNNKYDRHIATAQNTLLYCSAETVWLLTSTYNLGSADQTRSASPTYFHSDRGNTDDCMCAMVKQKAHVIVQGDWLLKAGDCYREILIKIGGKTTVIAE